MQFYDADAASWAVGNADEEAEEPTTPREEVAQLRPPTSPPWAPRKPRAADLRSPSPQHEAADEEAAARSAARRRKLFAEE